MRVVGGVPLWVNVCASLCRYCVFVSVVHPVAILIAVFCVICSLLMFVSDASGDHIVETYSSMGLIMALYAGSCSELLSTHSSLCYRRNIIFPPCTHTDTNPKNLELVSPQYITATILDQVDYNPKS